MELILNTYLLAILVSAFSIFLEMCFLKGFILRKYYVFISIFLFHSKAYIKGVRLWIKLPFRRSLFKVLGGCTYCSNFWQNVLFFAVYHQSDMLQFPLCLIVFLQAGFSHICLRLWFYYAER